MYALFATLGCIEAVARRFAALCSQCRTCRRARVGAIAAEEGFALNFRKTRCMGSATRQTVTGLVVNRFANIPRAEYDEIKAILHNPKNRS